LDLGIKDKVAVVAAGTRGIGLCCATALAREGAQVAVFGRDEASLAQAARQVEAEGGRPCLALRADLLDATSITNVFEQVRQRLGPVRILVANSVGPPPGGLDSADDEAWVRAFEGAFLSTLRMVRIAIPQMIECGGGSVVAVQSSSVKQPIPGMILSNGVRPGVAGLMKSLTQEYAVRGVRFNVVCPGRIQTERFMKVEKSHGGDFESRVARMAAEVPVGRLGQPAEVADAVVFLASERASYITGSVLAVDGGNVRSLY
jgi:3-oxoacyl-[acyl-carrier protein] reductase